MEERLKGNILQFIFFPNTRALCDLSIHPYAKLKLLINEAFFEGCSSINEQFQYICCY